ncbi:MAG: DUF6442 family protein [Treponema sp.]|nr:DUF6442 family protein [Treponema sp.]
MTKEEILEKSRNENQNKDIFDLEVQNLAAKISYYSAPVLCAIFSIIEFIVNKKFNFGYLLVLFGMFSVTFFVKFLKMHKKHELLVFISYLVLFILVLIVYIFQLLGKV